MTTPPNPSATVAIDVAGPAPPGVETVAVDVFWPAELADLAEPTEPAAGSVPVVVCLPGGWYSRAVFDLAVPDRLGSYSAARDLAASGLVVVTCDPPGIGGSDRPADPFALSPATLAAVHAAVVDAVLDRLAAGRLVAGLGPVDPGPVVGLGHSAGALLTVYAQAAHRPFGALALLGFSGRGLADHLTGAERAVAGDPEGLAAALPHLVEARFGEALPPFPAATASMFSAGAVPAEVKAAMRATQDRLLALLGLTAMVPGASARELAAVDVPVFLGVGDDDIAGPPHAIPADFPSARDVTLFVLPDCGHAPFVAPRRTELWNRLARWITSLSPRPRRR